MSNVTPPHDLAFYFCERSNPMAMGATGQADTYDQLCPLFISLTLMIFCHFKFTKHISFALLHVNYLVD